MSPDYEDAPDPADLCPECGGLTEWDSELGRWWIWHLDECQIEATREYRRRRAADRSRARRRGSAAGPDGGGERWPMAVGE